MSTWHTFVKEGNLDELIKIFSTLPKGNTSILNDAAEYGHLNIVIYLSKQSFSCTTWAMDLAAKRGHLDIVEWLHNNRTEGCTTYAVDLAAMNGHTRVVKWLLDNRSEGGVQAIDLAAKNGHLNMVVWLCKYKEDKNDERLVISNDAIDFALLNGHIEVVKWLYSNRKGCYTKERVEFAISREEKIVSFLKDIIK